MLFIPKFHKCLSSYRFLYNEANRKKAITPLYRKLDGEAVREQNFSIFLRELNHLFLTSFYTISHIKFDFGGKDYGVVRSRIPSRDFSYYVFLHQIG